MPLHLLRLPAHLSRVPPTPQGQGLIGNQASYPLQVRPPLRRTGETALSEVIPCPPVGEVGPPQFLGTSVDSRSLPLSLHHDSINDTPMLGCYHTHDPIYSPHTPLLDQFSAITSHTITHNAYPHTPDLLALERRGLSTRPPPLPAIPNFSSIVTPPVLHAWERALEHHPDSQFRDYLTNGLRHGFRVGFNHDKSRQHRRFRHRVALALTYWQQWLPPPSRAQ